MNELSLYFVCQKYAVSRSLIIKADQLQHSINVFIR